MEDYAKAKTFGELERDLRLARQYLRFPVGA